MSEPSEVTQLLQQLNLGDRSAKDRLIPLIYRELHNLARRQVAQEKREGTWQPTALIHEVYLRLVERTGAADWQGHKHFLRVASRCMRNILVDHARAPARRRREDVPDTLLDGALQNYDDRGLDILALHEALAELGERDPELVEVVEMRFFAGFAFAEIADAIGVTERTVYRRWCLARAWLRGVLGDDEDLPD